MQPGRNMSWIAAIVFASMVSGNSTACSLPQEGWVNMNLERIFATATFVADVFVIAERLNRDLRRQNVQVEVRKVYKGHADQSFSMDFALPTCLEQFRAQESVYLFLWHDGNVSRPSSLTFVHHRRAPEGFEARLGKLAVGSNRPGA